MQRRKSRQVTVGDVPVGGDAPISVQSMTKTDTSDPEATSAQIFELAGCGCEIIRVAVPDQTSAAALSVICSRSPIPVIADIHFDYRLALKAIDAGISGLRINPGNIGADWKVKEVVKASREKRIPIRVGVNAGSLEKRLEEKYGGPTPEALVESALREIELIEKQGYEEIKVAVKAFDVFITIEAYRLLAEKVDYPFHIGITEAGPLLPGAIRSSIGLGILLREGMGDTIRVSLTAPPRDEVRVGREILQVLGLRRFGPVIISCPTCGRCRVDLLSLIRRIEERINGLGDLRDLSGVKVAVMGCRVNGPGEARQADLGIAAGKKSALLFKKGKIVKRGKLAAMVEDLMDALSSWPNISSRRR